MFYEPTTLEYTLNPFPIQENELQIDDSIIGVIFHLCNVDFFSEIGVS
jgi:hypothetical protein